MKKNKEKRDLKNFVAYVKYQCGHGVSLDDALKNLGYVRVDKEVKNYAEGYRNGFVDGIRESERGSQ